MRPAIVWSSLIGLGILIGYVAALRLRPTAAAAKPAAEPAAGEVPAAQPRGPNRALQNRMTALEAELAALRSGLKEREQAQDSAPPANAAPSEAMPEIPTEESI